MNCEFIKRVRNIAKALVMLSACMLMSGYSGCSDNQTYGVALKGAIFARDYTKMSQAERDAYFKENIATLTAGGQSGAIDALFGKSALYISPEQQAAMFSNESTFVWSMGAMALAKGLVQPGTDEFLIALKDYGAYLPGQFTELTQDRVDKRIAALKARFGIYYDAVDTLLIRDLIWADDARFQSVMTDNQASYQIVAAGTLGDRDHWTGDLGAELLNFFLPTTTTAITMPPS